MAKGSFASIFIVGLFLSQVFAVPSSSFGSGDVTAAINALKAAQSKEGVYFGLKNTFFAVSGLRLLKVDVPNKDKICTSVSGKGLDAESIYYVAAVQESLGCGQAADNKVKDILESALKSTKSSDLTFALASVLTLSENKHISIEQKTIEDAFKKLVAGQDDDGSFAGSVLTTGLALQALAKYAKVAKAEDKERLTTVLESAVEVLSSADAGAGTLEFSPEKDASSLRVTSTYFNGLSNLAAALGKKVDTKAENVAQIAEFFVQNKQTGTVEDIFAVIQGIEGVKNFHIQPLVVSLLQNFISATAKANEGNIRVQVTDISGNAVSGAKVTLNKAVNREDKKSVASNQELTGAAGEFQYNFMTNKPEVGVYDLEFAASADKFAPTKSTQSLKVVGQVTIYESRVVVSDSKDPDDILGANKHAVEYPNTVASKVVAEHNQHLHVTFKLKHVASGKAAKAHQVMASLVNKATGEEVIVAASHDGSKYNAHFFVEDYADNFHGASGDYQLSVIVGDSSLQGTLTWKVGTVELRFPASAKKEIATPFGAKPEIQHKFREPEKRPSLAISSAFSLAVLAPWGVLFIGFIAVKANIGNFPTGGGFIWAVGYQATLGAILALYGLYWLRLNMVQTLTYLSILALPYLFFSQRALNYLATQNAKSKRE